ncbi:MAG: sulfotransferase domain-containing protein [Erythrobacter sp.]|uniref:sulfotransferase n=1 Tax=Erythrobacter sp. TaxID=1042 RepID=UPI0025CD96B6|nr:sulfotransferase [Erythrobacter sp.]MCL9998899.1 sulfotransferase domain-containing protein [Erythrobacter sp.]
MNSFDKLAAPLYADSRRTLTAELCRPDCNAVPGLLPRGFAQERNALVWTPNLIIAGVAKCGTTTLHDLLAQHPRVTGGVEKELWFINDQHDELTPPVNVHSRGLDAWVDQFPDKGKGDFDIWMDASATYEYQDTAKQIIATLDPQPKVMFIVREPAQRLFSLYQYARYHHLRIPHVQSFAQFIEEIREPVNPRLRDQNVMVHAWSGSQYDRMLEEWGRIVPPERLFVTSVEELSQDRVRVLTDIAIWLEIDPAGLIGAGVDRSNPTVVTRSRLVRQVGKKLAKILPETQTIRKVKTALRELNSTPIDRDERHDNAALLESLTAEFAPHMARFEQLRRELAWQAPARAEAGV